MEDLCKNDVWRMRLAKFFQRASGCAELSPIYLESVRIQSLYEQFEEATRVVFIGCIKCGRTSLINALLGTELLPIDDLPCTNNLKQEIKYGPNPKAMLHFPSPFPSDYRETLSDDIMCHLKYHNYGKNPLGSDTQIPALEIAFNKSLQYLRYPEVPDYILFDGDQSKCRDFLYKYEYAKSAFERIELFYPADILKKRMTFVDTNGINDTLHSLMFLKQIKDSDIVLWVMDAMKPCSLFEKDIIEDEIQPRLIKISSFIANRFDLVNRSDRIKMYIQTLLGNYVPKDSVFCVSAREALQAYKENNAELLAQSGILDLKAFIRKLAEEKERERYIASAKALEVLISGNMLPLMEKEMGNYFTENKSHKISDLILISSNLKMTAEGLKQLIKEMESVSIQ